MKILIPVNGTEHNRRAITYFFENRAFFDLKAAVTLMHVRPAYMKAAEAVLDAQTLERMQKSEVDKAMEWARARFAQSRVSFDEVIESGDPGAKIVEQAAKGAYDLVIMGSHIDEPMRRLVRGSVTLEVLSTCKVPALVIR